MKLCARSVIYGNANLTIWQDMGVEDGSTFCLIGTFLDMSGTLITYKTIIDLA